MQEHHLTVARTARYATLGPDDTSARDVWFVLHGYAQLAGDFLRHFAPLDDGARLLVAPEALSRFYSDRGRPGGDPQRVGATWMTREDRDAEVSDYVSYLDAVYDRVFERVPREGATVTLLGFSQGAATVSRWASLGRARADRVVCWGSALAHDLDLAPAGRAPLGGARLVLVVGGDDRLVASDAVDAERRRLAAAGVPHEVVTYDGGHHLHEATLRRLAGVGA